MIDHEKLKQAVKLLEESGADYALGYDCGGYTSYSASMIPDHCNIFDSLMREVIMGAARVVYISDGGLGALRSLDRMSKAITHARRETRFRAGEERVESGVPFMLAYDDTAKHMICRAFGNYPTLKEFIVTMMVQAVVNVQSKYGEEAAMKELMGMMTEAAQQYCEETKKAAEKHEVLN